MKNSESVTKSRSFVKHLQWRAPIGLVNEGWIPSFVCKNINILLGYHYFFEILDTSCEKLIKMW